MARELMKTKVEKVKKAEVTLMQTKNKKSYKLKGIKNNHLDTFSIYLYGLCTFVLNIFELFIQAVWKSHFWVMSSPMFHCFA